MESVRKPGLGNLNQVWEQNIEGGIVTGLNPENRVKRRGSHDSGVEKKHFH